MPRYIAHHNGWFFEWSTIVDAPVSNAMNRLDFEEWYTVRHWTEGAKDIQSRLQRAILKGTSSYDGESLEDLIVGNRAGEDEEEVSLETILLQVGVPEEDM